MRRGYSETKSSEQTDEQKKDEGAKAKDEPPKEDSVCSLEAGKLKAKEAEVVDLTVRIFL